MSKNITQKIRPTILLFLKLLAATWAFGLIWFSTLFAKTPIWNHLFAILFAALVILLPFIPRLRKFQLLIPTALALPFVLIYLSLSPSNSRQWEVSTSKTASAQLSGNILTIKNFRNFDYLSAKEIIPEWTTRSFDLSKLEAMDIFITYWGSELISHPIFSFDFGEDGHLAFSIEARRESFETYTVLGGFYRRYELIYIPCAETDAVRLRSNFRENEIVYLYRTVATPLQARARLLEFVKSTNDLKQNPRFYNVLLSNCTTAVRSQIKSGFAFDWRIILNGKIDKMLYERGMLETAGMPFEKLKEQSLINPTAQQNSQPEDFSERIRQTNPIFTK